MWEFEQTITYSDLITKVASLFKVTSQPLLVSDMGFRVPTFRRVLSDYFTYQDFVSRIYFAELIFNQPLTYSDMASRITMIYRIITQPITITETFVKSVYQILIEWVVYPVKTFTDTIYKFVAQVSAAAGALTNVFVTVFGSKALAFPFSAYPQTQTISSLDPYNSTNITWAIRMPSSFGNITITAKAYDSYGNATDTINVTVLSKYYLEGYLDTEQNLVKTRNSTITLTVYRVNIEDQTDKVLFENASITANITDPNGNVEYIDFTNHNNGTYTLEYNFDTIGTYKLTFNASADYYGSIEGTTYIYVGKFPIYVYLTGATEYEYGDDGKLTIYVEDSQGNPVTGASGYVNIYYPNLTKWVDGATVSELELGQYYYNFTVPNVSGVYITFANITYSGYSDTDSHTFHVFEARTEPSKIWNYSNRTTTETKITISEGNYQPGENVKIIATLLKGDTYLAGKNVTINIYYPNGMSFVDSNMTDEGSGVYSYSFTAPETEGDYMVIVEYGNTIKAGKFTVSTLKSTIETEHEETREEVKSEIKKQTSMIQSFVEEWNQFWRSNLFRIILIVIMSYIFIKLIFSLRGWLKEE
jgi:hypothetical protein